MLEANQWTEHRVPDGEFGEGTEGAEVGGAAPWGEQQYQLARPPGASWVWTTNQSTNGGTHGSRCICSRGMPCWTPMRGEALGPEKA